eukprot:1491406-Pleurochrysis_carterae.AAC.1
MPRCRFRLHANIAPSPASASALVQQLESAASPLGKSASACCASAQAATMEASFSPSGGEGGRGWAVWQACRRSAWRRLQPQLRQLCVASDAH